MANSKEKTVLTAEQIQILNSAAKNLSLLKENDVFKDLRELSVKIAKMDLGNLGINNNLTRSAHLPEMPKYANTPNIKLQQRPTIVELRLEGNDLVGRL